MERRQYHLPAESPPLSDEERRLASVAFDQLIAEDPDLRSFLLKSERTGRRKELLRRVRPLIGMLGLSVFMYTSVWMFQDAKPDPQPADSQPAFTRTYTREQLFPPAITMMNAPASSIPPSAIEGP